MVTGVPALVTMVEWLAVSYWVEDWGAAAVVFPGTAPVAG